MHVYICIYLMHSALTVAVWVEVRQHWKGSHTLISCLDDTHTYSLFNYMYSTKLYVSLLYSFLEYFSSQSVLSSTITNSLSRSKETRLCNDKKNHSRKADFFIQYFAKVDWLVWLNFKSLSTSTNDCEWLKKIFPWLGLEFLWKPLKLLGERRVCTS